jgi:hypothetical protein
MTQGVELAVRPEVARASARIMSGAYFTCLLLDDKQQRATALEAVLDKIADPNTRVAWVGNPLRSPLTIERFLIQIVGPEVDLRIERSPAQLVKLMTQPIGDENRLLVVVQQPETMGAEARDILAAIPDHLAGSTLQMQFLFVSASTFTLMTFNGPARPAEPIAAVASQPFFRPIHALVPVTLLVGIALGVGITLAAASYPTRHIEPSTSPIASAPAPVAVAAPVTPPEPPAPDLTTLRREFDTFLAKRAPTTSQLTENQKDALFREFLAQHRRN